MKMLSRLIESVIITLFAAIMSQPLAFLVTFMQNQQSIFVLPTYAGIHMSQYSHLWQSVCYLVSSNLYTSNLYISLPFALISKKGEICIAQQLFHKYPDISPFESLL